MGSRRSMVGPAARWVVASIWDVYAEVRGQGTSNANPTIITDANHHPKGFLACPPLPTTCVLMRSGVTTGWYMYVMETGIYSSLLPVFSCPIILH